MDAEYLRLFLEEQGETWGDLNWKFLLTGNGDYVCTIYAPDSSTLEYLNNNGFPVVYSDYTGVIVVKFG